MAVQGVGSRDRNYTELLNSAGKDTVKTENYAKKYGITYTNGDEGNLSVNDFFKLMITQLTNQDFMNPTSDSEYMAQMTQYSSLQAMQEMAKFTQQNYAMSMLGKNVTASKYSEGKNITETGRVEQLVVTDSEYQIKVNGKTFSISQIKSIEDAGAAAGTTGNSQTQGTETGQTGNGQTSGNTQNLNLQTDTDAKDKALG